MPFDLSSAYPFLATLWQIFKNWWWIPLPFLLWPHVVFLYHYYIKENWDNKVKKIILEIRIPRETIKPIRAMDQVFAGFHAIHDIATWREKWVEGVFQLGLSLEIVSIGGEIHFYIRTPEMFRKLIESNIYSQYPEAEISLVDDYTKYVPQNIPTKDWDIWGVDFVNSKDEIYPIKTYKQFETELEKEEEKRIDPLADFLEGLSTLKPGEQFWLQIIVRPVLGRDKPWQKKGRELADKLARRPEKKESKPIIQEAMEILISGPAENKEEVRELIPPEMKLTPGEREVLGGVEEKLAKFGYDCNVRFLYLGKREVFFKPTTKVGFSFFKEISTENLGGLKPTSKTMTKVKSVFFWFFDKRRVYLRKRRMLRYYKKRWSPLFPRSGMTYILNTEELATLYHFPSKATAPALGLSRLETKRKGVPSDLPVE
ncbi:MAG: hypothetical protein Q8P74_01440 [bacterium]|nr:hypothetical protein [bacterium]